MKIAITHPTGNQFVRALIGSFKDADILAGFSTTIAVNRDAYWLKFLPGKLRAELLRRAYPLDFDKIRTRPLLELSRMLLPKLGLERVTAHETGFASIDRVYHDLDRAMAASLLQLKQTQGLHAVYAYEDGALHTFKRAKALGLTCIYDLPIAYWETVKNLMQEEEERLPAWACTLEGGVADSEAKRARKTEELELADVVVVPGAFVKDSLPAWSVGKSLVVAPFGSPELEPWADNHISGQEINRPLRVLFAGALGQRKGLGDLFEAVKMLDPEKIELVVMGSLLAPMEFYRKEFKDFTYECGRPHQEVLKLMRSCDVLCLPSIAEGRALVMQEAMSQGLPLIITANTGGADLIIEGETGFLVPIRAAQQIAEKLNWCIENRAAVKDMGRKAKVHATKYTWKSYGDKIIHALSPDYAK